MTALLVRHANKKRLNRPHRIEIIRRFHRQGRIESRGEARHSGESVSSIGNHRSPAVARGERPYARSVEGLRAPPARHREVCGQTVIRFALRRLPRIRRARWRTWSQHRHWPTSAALLRSRTNAGSFEWQTRFWYAGIPPVGETRTPKYRRISAGSSRPSERAGTGRRSAERQSRLLWESSLLVLSHGCGPGRLCRLRPFYLCPGSHCERSPQCNHRSHTVKCSCKNGGSDCA